MPTFFQSRWSAAFAYAATITTLLAFAQTCVASPVNYTYFGKIIGSSGYAGVPVNSAIQIQVTYDLVALQPFNIGGTDGQHWTYTETLNGSVNGQPWMTWIHISAKFHGYTWQNDLMGGYENLGIAQYIQDNYPGNSPYTDVYLPFYSDQESDTALTEYRFARWQVDTSSSTPPSLTNGLAFPQFIDLSKGNQNGVLESKDPTLGFQFVQFVLNQNGIDRVLPEPGTLALLGLGLAGLGFSRRKR